MAKFRMKRLARAMGSKALRAHRGLREDLGPGLWNLHYVDSILALRGRKLTEVIEAYGSPIHLLDIRKLKENAHAIMYGRQKEKILDAYFSYKTHPVPGVLGILHDCGLGAEVASPYELWLAFRLGVQPQDIIYNGPAKTDESIAIAVDREIRLLNVNHREELERIVTIAEQVGKRVNVGIRVDFAVGWKGQFGFSVETGEAVAAFSEAVGHSNLNVVALHCHNCAPTYTLEGMAGYLQNITRFLDELHLKTGFHPTIVDVGGGIGIRTVRPFSPFERWTCSAFRIEPREPDPGSAPTLEDYSELVSSTLRGYFHRVDRLQPEIVIEPGRAISGNAQMLIASVLDTRVSDEGMVFAILDAGISVANIVTHEFHQILPVVRKAGQPVQMYRFVGPICHLGDTLYPSWRCPELSPGDAVAIMDSGAYFVSDSRAFSYPRPGIIGAWEDGRLAEIRQSDTFESLISLDHLSENAGG